MYKKFCYIILLFLFISTNLLAMVDKKNLDNYNTDTAIFAMGCFWCAESEFEELDGVLEVVSGYAGGTVANPTYENHPGYKEAIKITYDANKISYKELLDVFWRNVDPFDANGQFCDKGFAYTSAIFYQTDSELEQAQQSKQETTEKLRAKNKLTSDIATEIIKATTFYNAEDYHQDYKKKNPVRYNFYRWNCGRDKRLREIWN